MRILLLAVFALALPAAAHAQYNILYCSPNEGNNFTLQSGGYFQIATDCGSSNIVSGPAHGTLNAAGTDQYGDPQYQYIANAGFTGTDTITVFVSSSTGSSGGQGNFGGNSGNETVTFNIVPSPPTTTNASASVQFNTAAAINLSSDITGQSVTSVTVSSAPAHGTTSVSGETVTFTPTANFYGTDSFAYYATNAGGNSNVSTVAITVGTPPAPTTVGVNTSTAYNTADPINLTTAVSGADITAVTIVSGPTHGTTVVSGETVTYTPSSTFYGGVDSFTYRATNPGGTSNTSTVTITVGAPPSPTTSNATTSTPYNTAKAIDLTSSITGADVTSVAIVSGPSHGTAAVSGKIVTYTPASTFYGGTDSFTYTATNPGGTSTASTVTITVGAPPAPSVSGATATTAYNTATAINLTTNVTGVDITALTVASGPSHGTTSVSGEVVTYTPSASFFGGSDSFTYTATNPGGTSTPATVTITVGAPAAPTASSAAANTPYNTAATINLAGSISGTDITSVAVATGPTHGTAVVSGESVTYTPAATFYGGTDTFTYTATDPGGTSSPATVEVVVAAPAAPTAAAKSASTAYNTAVAIDLSGSITGADVTSVNVTTAPAHGTVTVNGEVATYTPAATFYGGTDTFAYTAMNPGGTSTAATVTVTVGTPAAPTAAAVATSTAYNTAAAINLTSSITGTDITAVTIATGPAHGTTTVSGEVVTYTPSSTFYGGTDTFTYTATNPGGTSSAATVTITVAAPAAPTAAAVATSTAYNTAKAIDLTSSITGTDITAVTIGAAPAHGTATVSGEVVTYTPSSTFYGGTDTFTYTATNPGGTSTAATVTITVATPAAPTAAPLATSTPYNIAKAIDLTSSITGTDITAVAIATAPAHGTATVSGEVVTYTPSSTFYGGTDTFTYTATNPGGTSSAATVTVTVAAPGAPTAAAAASSTAYNTAKAIDLTSSITGADITAVTIATAPAHGTAAVSGEVVTYTPSSTFYGGTDTFTYTATNPGGTSSAATVTVTVGTPGAPTVASVSASTAYNTAVAIDLTSSITGTDITSVQLATAPAHGTASVSGKTVTYTPAANFFGGTDSFTYTATNPGGTSASATVTITVSNSGSPTVTVTPSSATLTVGQPATNVAQASGAGGVGTLTYSIAPALPAGLQLNAQTGLLSGAPTTASAQTTYTVTVTDAGNHTGTSSFTLTVTGSVAAQTVIASKVLTTNQAATPFTPVTASGGTGSLTYSIAPALPAGLVLIAQTGTISGTPTVSIPATSFTVTAKDSNGDSASASFSLLVQPVPSPVSSTANVATGSAATFHVTAGLAGAPFTAVTITKAPTSGTAVVNGLDIVYVPDMSVKTTTTVTLTYTITSSYGTSAPATITITVTPSSPQISMQDKPPLSDHNRASTSQGGAA